MEVIFELISMGFQFAWNHMFVINMLLAIIIVFFERREQARQNGSNNPFCAFILQGFRK
jgi:hypothetical protein